MTVVQSNYHGESVKIEVKKKITVYSWHTTMRSTLGDTCDAWCSLEIESDRWNIRCKFTDVNVARRDSRNVEGEMFIVLL